MISSTPVISILDCASSLIRKILNRKIYYHRLRDKNIAQLIIIIFRSIFVTNNSILKNINGIPVIKSEVSVWSKNNKKLKNRLSIQSILNSLQCY
jgi:hypothetical protein